MTGNEKTTALIPSVGADGGQPLHDSTNQLVYHMKPAKAIPLRKILRKCVRESGA